MIFWHWKTSNYFILQILKIMAIYFKNSHVCSFSELPNMQICMPFLSSSEILELLKKKKFSRLLMLINWLFSKLIFWQEKLICDLFSWVKQLKKYEKSTFKVKISALESNFVHGCNRKLWDLALVFLHWIEKIHSKNSLAAKFPYCYILHCDGAVFLVWQVWKWQV